MDLIDLKEKTILYVEDDYMIQSATNTTLEIFGLKTIIANNGIEGIKQFKLNQKKIDLIITDIKMPQLDGISMVQEIRKINNQIPIIITTAHQESGFLKSSIELGVSSFLIKPIDIYLLKDGLIKSLEPILLKEELEKQNKLLKDEIKKNKEKHKLLMMQSRFATMGEMISMIAHQWRQPLASIGTAAFNLKFKLNSQKYDLSTENGRNEHYKFYLKKLNEIEQYVQTLTSTIDDFRNFYKPNKNKEIISIKYLIDTAYSLIKPLLEQSKIKISIHVENNQELFVLKNEIIHVLLNILKNAQDKFLNSSSKNKSIIINSKVEKNSIIIEIIDNGEPIPDELLNNIFEPYFSTKKSSIGTGIGLYMSRIIIEKHHRGRIEANNCENGVRLRIQLPKH